MDLYQEPSNQRSGVVAHRILQIQLRSQEPRCLTTSHQLVKIVGSAIQED